MRAYWRLILPLIGLILFGVESYHSYRLDQRLAGTRHRYHWWASIRLDSQPRTRTREATPPSCDPGTTGCTMQFDFVWVDPGHLGNSLMLTGLPAFSVEAAILAIGARLGVSEIWTFMLTMPILIAGWFYLVGWLVDRSILRRALRRRSIV
jgi:hypothetical protein